MDSPLQASNESREAQNNSDKPTSAKEVLAELAKEMRATRMEWKC